MARKVDASDTIIDAALTLAAERGWRGLSLAEIARRADTGMAELVAAFPNGRTDILDGFLRRVDAAMLAAERDDSAEPRDRLFEAMMARFEAMAPHRAGIAALLRDVDPVTLLCGARRFHRAMALTLEAAGFSSEGLSGLAKVEAVAAIYLYALRAFVDDDSPDLDRTMAALDKALRRAEGMAGLIFRGRGRSAPGKRPHGEAAEHRL